MYIPSHFRDDDVAALAALVRDNAFGLLVTCASDGELHATHLPFSLVTGSESGWRLLGHVARANPHWRALGEGCESLAVFSGAHGYISPRWYTPGASVPTWNYVAVHLRGRCCAFDGGDRLMDTLRRLSAEHEAGAESPWTPDGMPEDYRVKMLAGIVGIEMEVQAVEGKRKVSQNRSRADREGVVTALTERGDEQSLALAALTAATLVSPSGSGSCGSWQRGGVTVDWAPPRTAA